MTQDNSNAAIADRQLKWLEAFLEKHEIEQYDVDELRSRLEDEDAEVLEHEGLTLVEVDSNGGYEGGGEDQDVTFAVVSVEDAKDFNLMRDVDKALTFVQASGPFDSWGGEEWNDWEVMKPVPSYVFHPFV